jgi:hypothetical protein
MLAWSLTCALAFACSSGGSEQPPPPFCTSAAEGISASQLLVGAGKMEDLADSLCPVFGTAATECLGSSPISPGNVLGQCGASKEVCSEREFEALRVVYENDFVVHTVAPLLDGGYYLVSLEESSMVSTHMTVGATRVDAKGKVIWHREAVVNCIYCYGSYATEGPSNYTPAVVTPTGGIFVGIGRPEGLFVLNWSVDGDLLRNDKLVFSSYTRRLPTIAMYDQTGALKLAGGIDRLEPESRSCFWWARITHHGAISEIDFCPVDKQHGLVGVVVGTPLQDGGAILASRQRLFMPSDPGHWESEQILLRVDQDGEEVFRLAFDTSPFGSPEYLAWPASVIASGDEIYWVGWSSKVVPDPTLPPSDPHLLVARITCHGTLVDWRAYDILDGFIPRGALAGTGGQLLVSGIARYLDKHNVALVPKQAKINPLI